MFGMDKDRDRLAACGRRTAHPDVAVRVLGLAREQAATVNGDGLRRPVRWEAGDALNGQIARLKIHLRQASPADS